MIRTSAQHVRNGARTPVGAGKKAPTPTAHVQNSQTIQNPLGFVYNSKIKQSIGYIFLVDKIFQKKPMINWIINNVINNPIKF